MNKDSLAPVLGAASVYAGKVVGWITISSLTSALVLGFVGAIGGFLAKQLIDFIFYKKSK